MADKSLSYNTNTIPGGFAGRGSSKSSRRKYVRQVFAENMIYNSFPWNTIGKKGVNITLSKEDALEVNPHDDDPLVNIVQHENWDIKRVLIDPGTPVYVLF